MQSKPGPTPVPGKPRPRCSAVCAPESQWLTGGTAFASVQEEEEGFGKLGRGFMVLHGGRLVSQTLSKLPTTAWDQVTRGPPPPHEWL